MEPAGFVGRIRETAELRGVIDRAASGHGQTLVLVGDAGIGKSTLLGTVASLTPPDTTIVSVRAVESESHLVYAAAIDLLGPFLKLDGVSEGIGGEGRRLLEGLMAARLHTAGPMPLCRAALGAVLAASADGRLVALLVDDAQWLDHQSVEILLYIARRISNERVAIIASVRSGSPSPFLAADLAQLHVGGLLATEVDLLFPAHGVANEVVAQLHGVTGGNPLAMLEIVGGLSIEQRSAKVALPEFPPVGKTIHNAFGRRIAALPETVRAALVVVAAHGSGHTAVLYAALETLGHLPNSLLPAEEQKILTIEPGSVTFVHPLLRLVAYSSVDASVRRSAHTALGAAWWAEQPWRGAWHLAESAPGPDNTIASSVELAAVGARDQNAAAVAGELFRRSAELSADHLDRERRWMAAARCFGDAARPTLAAKVLVDILAQTKDPLVRADATVLHGTYLAFSESPTGACDLLRTEAARVSAIDPTRAVILLATAYTAALLAADNNVGTEIVADAGRLSNDAGPVGMLVVQAMQMQSALFDGRSSDAMQLLAPIEQLASAFAAQGVAEADHLLQNVALAQLILDKWQEAHTTISAVVRRGRAMGRDGNLAFAFAVACEAELRLGRWPEAYVSARRAGDFYTESADRNWATLSSLALCARVEAHLGLAKQCREHAENVIENAGKIGSGLLVMWARHALGLLALSVGDNTDAIRHLEHVATIVAGSGTHDPGTIGWHGDLIEAYWRSNRIAEALRVRSVLERHAHAAGRTSALMVVARSDAILGPPERAEAGFAQALAFGSAVGAPFEIARTHMLLAEWRASNGGDSTEPFSAALRAFEQLGATAWAARCRMLETGAQSTALISPAGQLAERELEAALLAARGLTNREIADELYLSPKTVENTLGKVYRKLAIHSRTQLAVLFLTSTG